MTGMLTGCGSDTTKITEGMQLVETLDYQGALNALISMGYSEEQAKTMIESQFGPGSSGGLVASTSSDAESAKETTICP